MQTLIFRQPDQTELVAKCLNRATGRMLWRSLLSLHAIRFRLNAGMRLRYETESASRWKTQAAAAELITAVREKIITRMAIAKLMNAQDTLRPSQKANNFLNALSIHERIMGRRIEFRPAITGWRYNDIEDILGPTIDIYFEPVLMRARGLTAVKVSTIPCEKLPHLMSDMQELFPVIEHLNSAGIPVCFETDPHKEPDY